MGEIYKPFITNNRQTRSDGMLRIRFNASLEETMRIREWNKKLESVKGKKFRLRCRSKSI